MTTGQYAFSQAMKNGQWLFTFSRHGGLPVTVPVSFSNSNGHREATFINAKEQVVANDLQFKGDSLFFEMPVFESTFKLRILSATEMEGQWIKGVSKGEQVWQVAGSFGKADRIPGPQKKPSTNITGRWAVTFRRADGSPRPAVGEFSQQGNYLTGTIINPSGDYRFLEGEVRGDSMYLTTFDGSHCYAFTAFIKNDSTILDGRFFSGVAPGDPFVASKNSNAQLPSTDLPSDLRPGANRLSFQFPDLDSNMVSINDDRFKGKVAVVQLMGSWCPNCMDETKFLSEFYNSQQTRQVEMIALAYELSADFDRSEKSLRKFQQRFNVQYPILITGARSSDADKAAKTLPEMTDIKYFPTTIFIDKKGVVRKIHHGFYGPGAPEYFEKFKQEFFETLEMLNAE